MISYNSIPALIRTPGVFIEFDPSRAVKGTSVQPHRVLLIGQQLSGGAATAGTINALDSADDARVLYGAKAQLAQMAAAYKAADPLTELFGIGLADGGSAVSATGSIVWTGTATETRELVLYVGGRRIPVTVVKGDLAAAVETSALAALAEVTNDLSVSFAGNAAAGIDFTAMHGGTLGNQIQIGHSQLPGERVPAGLAVTVTAMASGATDPSYAGVVTAMGDDWYNTIVTGLTVATPVGLLVTELESRWGPMRQIEGQLFGAFADSRANLTTLGNSFNSFAFSLLGLEVSPLIATPWEVAAAVAGVDAAQTQIDPSRALTGLLVPNVLGARQGSRFTRAQRDTLLSDGVSTFTVSQDGRMRIERLITTYQTNAAGLPDTALMDLHPGPRLLAALRYDARVMYSTKFARFKLTSDPKFIIPPGQPIANEKLIRSETIAMFMGWMDRGWVEYLDQFKAELVVEIVSNRVNLILPPDLIDNLLVMAASIQWRN